MGEGRFEILLGSLDALGILETGDAAGERHCLVMRQNAEMWVERKEMSRKNSSLWERAGLGWHIAKLCMHGWQPEIHVEGVGNQLKGSLGLWAAIWQDSIFVRNFSAKWWGHGREQSCRYGGKLIKVSAVPKWSWGVEKGKKTDRWQTATAGIQQAPRRASVKASLGVLEWFNLHDCSHICKKYRKRLGDSSGFSQSYSYLWLMRLNMFLNSASTLFSIITSVLIFILLISVKVRKENIRLRSSQCLLPHPSPAKLCHGLLMLVSLPCCPSSTGDFHGS